MSLSRRGFLTGMLALGAAPAIVRAASLMKVVTPSGLIWSGVDLAHPGTERTIITASDLLGQRGRDYYIIMHPSAEQAMRELMITGSATVLYQEEIKRYG